MNRKESLAKVETVYSFWGRFPLLYTAQDIITFFGRAGVIRRKAVQTLGLHRGDKALEVACGTGRNFRFLVEAAGPEGHITGFDYSPEMLNAARALCNRNGWKNIRLIQGDAAELGIGDEKFDGVLSILGISAVPDWERALQRCRAVLKPEGKLVVCDARLFGGFLEFLNPLVRFIYSRFAAWDPEKNIPAKMRDIFGNVEAENFNWGTFFIARSVKEEH